MSSYINRASIILGGVLLMNALPAIAAGSGVSGASIVDCSVAGLSPDYVQNVCQPLQSEADKLLNGFAQPPAPIVMKEPLNIQQYRTSGINAIIQFSKNNNQVNSNQSNVPDPLNDIKSWSLQAQ